MKLFRLFKIKYKLFMLGATDTCMPIDIFSISNSVQELHPAPSVQNLVENYINDESAFVRRVMITAIRFIGGDFARENDSILRNHLEDKDEWVSYDSIWALAELGDLSEKDKEVISGYAKQFISLSSEQLEGVKPESAAEHRNKKAAEVLLNQSST